MNKFDILKKYFGYSQFREGQETLIDAVLSGRDALGIMPTGAGKSLCYQVPALLLPGITIVISPLISLMKDQVQTLNQAGIHAAYINSSLTENQIAKALQLAAKGTYKIIYAAPERLETYVFLEFAKQAEISMLTVDEAHCISQWGQDFRPSYLKIVRFLQQLERRPIVSAFTATATEHVREDIVCVLGLRQPELLITGFDRGNLYFAVETPKQKDRFVLDYIKAHPAESGIIYCSTRKNVDALFEKMQDLAIPSAKYHAGMGQEERRQSQEDFVYDRCPVMTATNAFGMGIDKSNVRYVIHYNMPQSLENYYQEAGRAGRDGETAECILLYSPQDVMINQFLLESKEQNPEFTEEELAAIREKDTERLRIMNYYCLSANCLRAYILNYFGEQSRGDCQNCGNCRKEFEETDVTAQAEKIISCVREMRGRYGINVAAGTLAGADRAKLREYGMTSYSSYGSLAELGEQRIKQIINQMLMEGYLTVTPDKYALLRLTGKSDEIAQGMGKVVVREVKGGLSSLPEKPASSVSRRKSDILNSRGLELFERLRSLRSEIARREGMPPYIIFSDKTLVDMCVRLPLAREEMLEVNGVGEHKFKKYGEPFLEEIRAYTGEEREKLYFGEMEEAGRTAGTGKQPANTGRKKKKAEFFISQTQAKQFPYADKYLAPELAVKLNELRDADTVKKTSGAEIIRRSQERGLSEEKLVDGLRCKAVTEKGKEAGLFLGTRISQKGMEYQDIYYDRKAQGMVVEWFIQ
ncbi:DNA helicase RecQ [Petralouisia muris]|uniref:DNA helicase RecQ n=1 Tax=Petralouisia muris TaxID=3032872 RepID=A0AC61RV67_9FIRM|nr:DNA helicase RecQ [Petralouisia muris]TGY95841.1 DNA helicase RecQ [Petralouisia muris]